MGRIIAFLNGKRVLDKRGLTFRYTPDLGIDLLYFTTFFGGSSRRMAIAKGRKRSTSMTSKSSGVSIVAWIS